MERALEAWKIFWPDGIPRSAYQKALALAAMAIDEQAKVRPAVSPTPPTEVSSDDISVIEASKLSGAHPDTIRRNINSGALRGERKSGGRGEFQMRRADLNAWMATRRFETPGPKRGLSASTQPLPPGDFLTVAEIAGSAGITASGVIYYVTSGRLKAERKDGMRQFVVARADAEAFIKERQS